MTVMPHNSPLQKATRRFQARLAVRVLREQGARANKAAAQLGIHRNTLTRILRRGAGTDVLALRLVQAAPVERTETR